MVFSSYIFLFAFLPLVLGGYYLLSRVKNPIWQRLFLIGASLYFYGYFNPSYLVIIVVSILANYILAYGMSRSKGAAGTVFFWLGVLFNVGLLGYFKYRDFFVENINALFHTSLILKRIALPLGISFFTFQQLSFLVSIRKGEEVLERFDDYCIFVLFFPQLVAGPIVLYSEMIPQFKDETRRYWSWDNAAKGAYIFAIGLFKKAVIADTLALFADTGFAASSLGFCAAWATALSYTFQVYFDFSGYSDMAVGLGKLFNIDIPFNFRSPYQSESSGVFWRRWHITLGRALQSYIYFPLGGSREGKLKTYRNLLVTFLVSGLWHGAAWTFVLWGALHGLFNALERVFSKPLSKVPRWLRVFGTFLIVNALWVLFRADSFANAAMVYRGMADVSNLALTQVGTLAVDGFVGIPVVLNTVYVLGLLALLTFVCFRCENSCHMLARFTCGRKTRIVTAILFCIALVHLSRESVFIYFNF